MSSNLQVILTALTALYLQAMYSNMTLCVLAITGFYMQLPPYAFLLLMHVVVACRKATSSAAELGRNLPPPHPTPPRPPRPPPRPHVVRHRPPLAGEHRPGLLCTRRAPSSSARSQRPRRHRQVAPRSRRFLPFTLPRWPQAFARA